MPRRSLFGFLLLCTLSLLVVAQGVPALIQPREAGYSPAQLAALEESIDRLGSDLRCTDLGSRKQLGVGGWGSEDFAAFTAGSLERLGYQVVIVTRQVDGAGREAWVVVRVDLGEAIAWIPVEPLPYANARQIDLGIVPIVAPLVYESSYLSYDTVLELPPNIAPSPSIRFPVKVVQAEQCAWLGNSSVDPDGEVVLFQWTFWNEAQQATNSVSAWYTFEEGGRTYPVSLTVTDSRGAQATASTTVYVKTLDE